MRQPDLVSDEADLVQDVGRDPWNRAAFIVNGEVFEARTASPAPTYKSPRDRDHVES